MPVPSIRLIVECERKGVLTKAAALRLLQVREDLIKVAMRKQGAILVEAIRNAPDPASFPKEAGFPDFGFGRSAKKSEGFLSKLKSSGVGASHVGLNLAKMLALAGLTAGATAGVGGIIRHSRDKKMRQQVESSASQLYDENPRLKEIEQENPGKVMAHFGLLAKFAPSLAAEPSIAGPWIIGALKQQAISPADIRNLAETQHKIDEMHEGRHVGPDFKGMALHPFATKPLELGSQGRDD